MSLVVASVVGVSYIATTAVFETTRPPAQKPITGVCANGTQAKAVTPEGGLICDGSVPAGAIGSIQLQSESVHGEHLANCSVNGGVGGVLCDGSIVAADVNPAQVQVRVSGICTAGFVRRINEDGGVNCSSILPPNSVGIVQLVDGSVTSAKLANNSVGAAQLVVPEYGRGTPNGLATLDPSGKVPQAQLPPMVSVTNVTVCQSPTGLTDGCCPRASGGVGGVCILPNATYIWQSPDYVQFSAPSGQVQSVNSKTGIVVLNSDDILQGTTNLYLRANSVQTIHLVNQSVTSAAIADMTIQSVDLGSSIITASKMATSSVSGGVGGTIVDGSIVAADVNSAQIQLRVTGTCAGAGTTMTGVTAGGGVTCDSTAANHVAITAGNPHGTRIDQLIDAGISAPTEGQLLQYTGGAWRNVNYGGGGGGGVTRLSQLDDVRVPFAKLVPLADGDALVYFKERDAWINHPVPILGVIHINLFCTTRGRRSAPPPGSRADPSIPRCEVTGEGYHVVFPEIADRYTDYPVTLTVEEPVQVTAHVLFDSRTSTSFNIGMLDRDGNPTHVVLSVMVMNPTKQIFSPASLPADKK